jgi:hypothetical protein
MTPMMISLLRPIALLLTPIIASAHAPAASGAQDSVAAVLVASLPTSTMTIRGSTTVGAHWSCTATNVRAEAILPGAEQRASTAALVVSVMVPVYSLRCQNAPMERAMRQALRAEGDSSSAIRGHFAGHAPDARSTGTGTSALASASAARSAASGAARLDGTLAVAGVERIVVFQAVFALSPDGFLRVQTSVPLRLTSFGISAWAPSEQSS